MANIITVKGKSPRIHPTAFIAPNATLIGEVEVEAGANVWFGAVLRADQNLIHVGEKTSVQDNTVIHCNEENATILGHHVTIGHGAVLEGCEIRDWALVGMNASVLDGAVVETGALVAAGSVVKESGRIPEWTLAAGVPAKPKKKLEGIALEHVKAAADQYQFLMSLYEHLGKPVAEPRER